MLADFYSRRLSNDMKIAVNKNNLGGPILYRSLEPLKNGVMVSSRKKGTQQNLGVKFNLVIYMFPQKGHKSVKNRLK